MKKWELSQTLNYSMFKIMPGNRQINERQVRCLVKSMLVKDLHKTSPIYVNENNYVLDGQHRLEARKKLGLPVYYIIVDNNIHVEDIIRLNSTSINWQRKDIMQSFCKLGNENYMFIKKIMEDNDFPIDCALAFIYGFSTGTDGNSRDAFGEGKLNIIDKEKILYNIERWKELGRYVKFPKKRCFVTSVCMMLKTPWYDHIRMMQNLEKKGLDLMLYNFSDVKSYLDVFSKIYNLGRSTKYKKYFRRIRLKPNVSRETTIVYCRAF